MNLRTTKLIRILALMTVLALILAACGDDTGSEDTGSDDTGSEDTASEGDGGSGLLAEIQETGTVTVGIANEIPYGYEDEETGEITGEAPEIAKEVFAEMGVDNMEARVVEFGALIGGLQAGNFDMIAAGMFINPDRAAEVIFTDPDYCIQESMLVPEGNPAGLTDYSSVADTDVRLAVASGTVNVDYAIWAGIPEAQIVEFAGIEDQYDALAAGRVDAVSGTSLTVQQHADAMDGFEALPGFDAIDENGDPIYGCGGFAFLDQELRDAFNDVLKQLQEDGTVQEIVSSFGFPDGSAELAADLTVEDLVGG